MLQQSDVEKNSLWDVDVDEDVERQPSTVSADLKYSTQLQLGAVMCKHNVRWQHLSWMKYVKF